MLPGQAKIFLLLVYCISSCQSYLDDEDYILIPEDVVIAIRPRRSFHADKRSSISREKRVQMINDLINYMNDAERLRFGR